MVKGPTTSQIHLFICYVFFFIYYIFWVSNSHNHQLLTPRHTLPSLILTSVFQDRYYYPCFTGEGSKAPNSMPKASQHKGWNLGWMLHPPAAARYQQPSKRALCCLTSVTQTSGGPGAFSSFLGVIAHLDCFSLSHLSPRELPFTPNKHYIYIQNDFPRTMTKCKNICNIMGFLPLLIMGSAIKGTLIFNS